MERLQIRIIFAFKEGDSSQKINNSHDIILEYLNDIDNKLPPNRVTENGLELIIADFNDKLEKSNNPLNKL